MSAEPGHADLSADIPIPPSASTRSFSESEHIDLDARLSAGAVRDVLFRYLALESVFPRFSDTDTGSSALCLLSPDPQLLLSPHDAAKTTWRDQVLCKVLPKSASIGMPTLKDFMATLSSICGDIPTVEASDTDKYVLLARPEVYRRVKHPGIANIIMVVNTPTALIIVQDFSPHDLSTLCLFHFETSLAFPSLARDRGAGARDVRLRFILYQLLSSVSYFHNAGMRLDPMDLKSIEVDNDIWATIRLKFSVEMFSAQSNRLGAFQKPDFKLYKHPGHGIPLTLQWIERQISNFEYLMAINTAAGRIMGDVSRHPIIPWVTNFSADLRIGAKTNEFALRDLTKSKFRLSKGEKQLESTFSHSEPPHHIPEILAELTYLIYMARKIPMHLLQRDVRSIFVPEHYPVSMKRMFEWSPDECIPEFFMDTTVFRSIHKEHGLNDIELPKFAPTPHEFIAYHRMVLESDFVSSQLHNWIDLAFGSKLIGQSAVDNLNVPLSHSVGLKESVGGPPDLSKHPGFVVLFTSPHPKRHSKSRGSVGDVDKYCVGVTKSSTVVDMKATSSDGSIQTRQDMLAYVSEELNRPDSVMSNLLSNMSVSLAPDASSNPSEGSSDSSSFKTNKSKKDHKETPSLLRSDIEDISRLILCHEKKISMASYDAVGIKSFDRSSEHLDVAKFAMDAARVLEPAVWIQYEVDKSIPLGAPAADAPNKRRKGWDSSFFDALNSFSMEMCSHYSNSDHARDAQANDVLSLGLVFAFLFCSESPLSEHDAAEVSKAVSSSAHLVELTRQYFYDNPKLAGVPVATRRLITMMLHPIPWCRPTVSEILEACMIPDRQSGEDELRLHIFYKDMSSSLSGEDYACKLRRDFLIKHCGSVFPSYLSTVYSFISNLKMAESNLRRFESLAAQVSVIESIPLDGLSLLLSHVTPCISDAAEAFEECLELDISLTSNPLDEHISSFCKILDSLGARLGVEAFSVVVSPCIAKFFEKISSAVVLRRTFGSQLFDIILKRAGLKTFLRHYLPIIITWLIAGSLKILLLTGHNTIGGDIISHVCWTSLDHDGQDVSDKLIRSSSLAEIQSVQEATVQALGNLAQSRCLGPGLCLRYILPAVLCLICNPNLSITGYSSESRAIEFQTRARRTRRMTNDLPEDEPKSEEILPQDSIAELNDTIDALATYNPHQMYAVKALEVLCMCFGALATAEVVVPYIVHVMYPRLEALLAASPNVSSTANSCLLEFVQSVVSIAPILSPQTIVNAFFMRQKSGLCILDLLLVVPMPKCQIFSENPPEDEFNDIEDQEGSSYSTPPLFKSMVQFFRCYRSFIELCRMITTLAQIAGPAATLEHVIPFVDTFFNIFIGMYSEIPVTSVAMSHAFNVGVNLYMPLMQLVGPEAMAAAALHINPRLEVWMSATSYGSIGMCPPLPPNILPEAVSEQDKKPEEGRLAKFMSWVSSSNTNTSSQNNGKSSRSATLSVTQESFSDISVAAGVALASLKEAMGTEQPVSTSKWKYFDNTILTQPFESATPRLGISCKLQSHINLSRDGSSPPPAWTIRRTGAARKGVRNIFHGAGDERVGVMFSHMTGIDAAENDAAWLVSGNYRWRTDPNNVEGDDFTAEYIKAGGNQKGRSTIAFNVANATIARRKGVNPAAQLSLTSPKITVDTASDAGSAFSLQMISKLQFYPDTVGVPVKLMVPNEVESLLLTGHRNGKVKVWNIADHPLSTVAKYSVSTTPQSASSGIFAGGFLRDSRNIYACDGTIRVWDTETRELLVEIPSEMGFSTCSALPASCGVTASIGSVGDNVLVACSCTSVYYFDLRVRNHGAYSAVAEWKLPIPLQNLSVVAESNVPGVVDRRRAAVASSGSTENNNSSVPLLPLLTCCVTSNDVLYAGANNGFITAVDRRTTKPLITWQAHATGVVKIFPFDRSGAVSVSEKSARIWDVSQGQRLRLIAQVRGLPDSGSNAGCSNSAILMNSFEQFDSYADGKRTHFLYCLAGNKISAGRLPNLPAVSTDSNYTQFSKENDDGDNVYKLKKSGFLDKAGASIPRQKLQITSAALLPLRQLLLVGSEDGLIRVVS